MRFVVRTCDGYLNERSGRGGGAAPGRSYVVLDTRVNHRLVAEYRTEDYRGGTRKRARLLAERFACEHAASLNAR